MMSIKKKYKLIILFTLLHLIIITSVLMLIIFTSKNHKVNRYVRHSKWNYTQEEFKQIIFPFYQQKIDSQINLIADDFEKTVFDDKYKINYKNNEFNMLFAFENNEKMCLFRFQLVSFAISDSELFNYDKYKNIDLFMNQFATDYFYDYHINNSIIKDIMKTKEYSNTLSSNKYKIRTGFYFGIGDNYSSENDGPYSLLKLSTLLKGNYVKQ